MVKYKGTLNFTTKEYATSPSGGYAEVLRKYIEDKIDKNLLTFAQRITKKNSSIENTLGDILSVFHRDEKGIPMHGAWMMRACLLQTANAVFNAKKDKDHPPKSKYELAIGEVTPETIHYHNGKLLKKPDGIDTYAITTVDKSTGKPRSFFKAYEFFKPGTTFDVVMEFDEDLMNEKCIKLLLSKCGRIGTGAYRTRFSKFEWVKFPVKVK